MRVYGTRLQRSDIGLRVGFPGNAARRFSPVIQYVRDVTDLRARLTDAEHELEVLHAVKFGVETHPLRELPAQAEQMADIHCAAEIFRRPIRLVEALNQFTRSVLELVLIGIKYVVVFLEFRGDERQRIGGEQVVMYDEANVIAGRDVESGVARSPDSAIGLQLDL